MNYEKDIEIDENSLDIEWLNQPSLMLKYTRHSARMRMELDLAKQNLDIAKAESDKAIRGNPEKYGIEKVTEAVIANAILIHPKYQQAYTDYLTAKFEVDMAQGAVGAFEQRKSALENLVRLHGQQYFAGPKIPRDLTWERAEKQKSSNESIAGKLHRKK
jgi:hypothetical protein